MALLNTIPSSKQILLNVTQTRAKAIKAGAGSANQSRQDAAAHRKVKAASQGLRRPLRSAMAPKTGLRTAIRMPLAPTA